MKINPACLFILFVLSSSCLGYVSKHFKIEGIIKSFDKDTVKLKTKTSTFVVPRSTVVTQFDLKEGCPVTALLWPEELRVEGKSAKVSTPESPFTKAELASPSSVKLEQMPK
ncbi:MAG: hypothetical protein HY537_14295 [Deltaproteobacteria bacterium]|nr:hypothetical protein [Deltaproteobacteria bacterium]